MLQPVLASSSNSIRVQQCAFHPLTNHTLPTVAHALEHAAALQVLLHEAEQARLVRAGRHCGSSRAAE